MKRSVYLGTLAVVLAVVWPVNVVAQTAISADGVVESTSGGFKFPDLYRKVIDIKYRVVSDLARELELKAVKKGTNDVVLPLYETGHVVLRCRDTQARPVCRLAFDFETADGKALHP